MKKMKITENQALTGDQLKEMEEYIIFDKQWSAYLFILHEFLFFSNFTIFVNLQFLLFYKKWIFVILQKMNFCYFTKNEFLLFYKKWKKKNL